jgi:hypothetical protein
MTEAASIQSDEATDNSGQVSTTRFAGSPEERRARVKGGQRRSPFARTP